VGFAGGLVDETELDIIAVAVSGLAERLARISVTEIIDPPAANAPSVAGSESPGMVPD